MRRLSLLLLLSALVARVANARQERGAIDPFLEAESAAGALERGTKLFEQKDYQGALDAFKRAHKLKPHFLTLCKIARCHARQNHLVQSAAVYRRCLRSGGGQSAMAASLSAEMARVEQRITTLTVETVVDEGMVYLDGRLVGPAPRILSLNPGTHVVEVRRSGARPASGTVVARGGEHWLELNPVALEAASRPVVPRLAAAPRPARPQKPKTVSATVQRKGASATWFWAGVGVTLCAAAAAAVMGVLTNKTRDDFYDAPTWDRYHQVNRFRLATNILWGVTAAAGVATTVVLFFTDFGASGQDGAGRGAGLGVGISGSF